LIEDVFLSILKEYGKRGKRDSDMYV
jgi:hypothetical protein